MEYTGYMNWAPTSEELSKFYQNGTCPIELVENEYLILRDEFEKAFDYYHKTEGKLEKVPYTKVGARDFDVLKPRNPEQYCAFYSLMNPKTTIKLITGTWGTGKTCSVVAAANQMLSEGKFDKIVWVRNNIELKDTSPIGALPGDLHSKLLPYLGPFIDHTTEEYTMELIEKGKLTVEHLGFLRGRDFKHSILIVTEAENLTLSQLQLIIARLGEGSILMMDADVRQRDKKVFEDSRGIETMIDRLAGEELFETVKLVKTERSASSALADKLN